jgi:ribosomal-protein-alanine N-acetyltransferase
MRIFDAPNARDRRLPTSMSSGEKPGHMWKSQRRVAVAPVREADGAELVAANLASIALHAEWVVPPRDAATFLVYARGCDGERRVGLIARERATRRIVGVINLSDIVRGALQGAYLGYYAVAGGTGRGLMTEALSLAVGQAFGELGLHRLEANIQPGNAASLALARRLGFRREGFSPRYLCIAGRWRDHERWALLSDEWERPAFR